MEIQETWRLFYDKLIEYWVKDKYICRKLIRWRLSTFKSLIKPILAYWVSNRVSFVKLKKVEALSSSNYSLPIVLDQDESGFILFDQNESNIIIGDQTLSIDSLNFQSFWSKSAMDKVKSEAQKGTFRPS